MSSRLAVLALFFLAAAPGSATAAELRRSVLEEPHGLNRGLRVGPVVAALVDAHSTIAVREACEQRGIRFVELNPVMRPFAGNDAALFGVKLGVGLAISHLADKAARGGKPRLGKAVAILGIVLPGAVGIDNYLEARRIRTRVP